MPNNNPKRREDINLDGYYVEDSKTTVVPRKPSGNTQDKFTDIINVKQENDTQFSITVDPSKVRETYDNDFYEVADGVWQNKEAYDLPFDVVATPPKKEAKPAFNFDGGLSDDLSKFLDPIEVNKPEFDPDRINTDPNDFDDEIKDYEVPGYESVKDAAKYTMGSNTYVTFDDEGTVTIVPKESSNPDVNPNIDNIPQQIIDNNDIPFDPRINRLIRNNDVINDLIPHDASKGSPAFNDMLPTHPGPNATQKELDAYKERHAKVTDTLIPSGNAWGVNAIMNPYATISLYNGLSISNDGGPYKVDKNNMLDIRGRKKFYDINSNVPEDVTSVKTPTTTNIIKYGAMDEFGRTPYAYQDFVFCKWWNRIPNNRLLTLRRYPLPTLDNLNFPTMEDGESFTPLATAVTYFGGETNNKLSTLLSFTVGMNWTDVKGDLHNISGEPVGIDNMEEFMDNTLPKGGSLLSKGSRGLAKGYAALGKFLAFTRDPGSEGSVNSESYLSVPDPYNQGPLENKLMGPINVINSVKKREQGLTFKNDMTIEFNYISRPIGGINTKAIMLDILANMLIMGFANGTFWGGSYRFMLDPKMYPLKDFNEFNKKLYTGDLEGAAGVLMTSASSTISSIGSFISSLNLNIGDIKNTFSSFLNTMSNAVKNITKGEDSGVKPLDNIVANVKNVLTTSLSTKTSVKQLSGLKALLTGEPVGDWHLVVGNPLNPIATIGNLIVTNVSVKFGDELGPDDFPLELTVTVSLEHGMARDKSAVESMFNLGAGRIYTLPDYVVSSAENETKVDEHTGMGTRPAGEYSSKQIHNLGYFNTPSPRYRGAIEHTTSEVVNSGTTTLAIPKYTPVDVNNPYLDLMSNEITHRSTHLPTKWVYEKAIK